MVNPHVLHGLPLAVVSALALTPVAFGLGPHVEARLFPVLRDAEIRDPVTTDHGLSFTVAFRKVRACEFLALTWYEGPVRHAVVFDPETDREPLSRPMGEQIMGPWLVRGLRRLEGSRAYTYHRCHPLWTTITPFYQG